ncbi:MAG: BlaI/MecI/CopY family transcriptional regulator [Clostridia bacterium]|nr:BlaI/MecI/CopY family transcriptional regulator [Clostridia bacterium]
MKDIDEKRNARIISEAGDRYFVVNGVSLSPYTYYDSLKGFVQNEGTVVTSLIDRDSAHSSETESFVENTIPESLPRFLTAFFNGKTISDEEAEELKKLIDSYRG